ncbi:MAG: hypothetical protein D6785_01920, partial [Planctomycetota bacterium]
MSENPVQQPESYQKREFFLLVIVIILFLGGVYFIYGQIKQMGDIGGGTQIHQPIPPKRITLIKPKPSHSAKSKQKYESLLNNVDQSLKKGAKWLKGQFIHLDSKKGGWPHFQWEEKKPGAPTTALATFSLASLPKRLQETYLGMLEKGIAFLLSKMDEKGAISEKEAHIQYRNYTTAMTLSSLCLLDKKRYREEIKKIQSYLIHSQLLSIPRWNWHYGTWNYYETPHLGLRVDISVTAYVLESLYLSGLPRSSSTWKKALIFLKRCQNYGPNKDKRVYDGGFRFHPRNSKAGEVTLPSGDILYLSYGSATSDGLRSLLYSGLSLDHERVKRARTWLVQHFSSTVNPGFGREDPAGFGRGMRFYYFHSVSKAMKK